MEILIIGFALYGGYMLLRKIANGGLLNFKIPFVTNKGLTAVRAMLFIILVEDGENIKAANNIVMRMHVNMPQDMIYDAQNLINSIYNGNIKLMLKHAKEKGFKG